MGRLRSTTWRSAVRALIPAAVVMAALLVAFAAQAQTYRIIALGASNTAGFLVAARAAWPAQLEARLRAQNHDVEIINAGVNGDDTRRMLARMDRAVPRGADLVILDTTDTNDRRRGIDTEANVADIVRRLEARGIQTLVIPSLHALSGRRLRWDGIHLTPEGHAVVAERLAPRVTRALGRGQAG